jgi:hypothetical protein
MSRKWLLSILTGLVLTVGGAAGATAAEALPLDPLDDPVEVEVPGVGSVAVEAETEEPSLSVSAEGEAEVPEAETTVEPTVDAEIGPDGLDVDLDGDTEVADEDVPVDEVTDPVEDTVSRAPDGTLEGTGGSEAANDGEVRSAPAPAPAPAGPSQDAGDGGDARTGTHVPAPVSADRAAVRAGIASQPEVPTDLAELAPEVAPPLLAAATSEQPPVEMALPVGDTTPTIPALLRMLAGLMVMGAAVTWKTVNDHAI